jgi:hypothetical protein
MGTWPLFIHKLAGVTLHAIHVWGPVASRVSVKTKPTRFAIRVLISVFMFPTADRRLDHMCEARNTHVGDGHALRLDDKELRTAQMFRKDNTHVCVRVLCLNNQVYRQF